ncbi:YqgE/AlgH family protein [Ornithinimicrobium sp. INDO-MA30-4]|uniref:YqgE/AlgH family protein n=1 Tax=Ornithinimicrobium sp. INDO-MA30-4 TaxID=2908651 RepID=UPI001F194552|nr:YqgE/AlgH family protein [Ornithinimicrobium sp. INDO-MA30-4]UJH70785.1 YqgE/AlgH family protein [Ornithinimicrobium sp. INDO-MA30-4]
MTADDPLIGKLLVATPITGGDFERCVVVILAHSGDGSQGVVLNDPSGAEVDAVLPHWHSVVVQPPLLYHGGPVGTDAAMGLAWVPEATDDDDLIGLHPALPQICLVDLDAPVEIVAGGAEAIRLFVGYAGWSDGQLEDEIAEGAWFVVDLEPADVFRSDSTALWRDVLARQRNSMSLVTTYTDTPEAN